MIIDHGKYKIVEFTANNRKFYQARIKINETWWYSKNSYPTALEAGDEARAVIYR